MQRGLPGSWDESRRLGDEPPSPKARCLHAMSIQGSGHPRASGIQGSGHPGALGIQGSGHPGVWASRGLGDPGATAAASTAQLAEAVTVTEDRKQGRAISPA